MLLAEIPGLRPHRPLGLLRREELRYSNVLVGRQLEALRDLALVEVALREHTETALQVTRRIEREKRVLWLNRDVQLHARLLRLLVESLVHERRVAFDECDRLRYFDGSAVGATSHQRQQVEAVEVR